MIGHRRLIKAVAEYYGVIPSVLSENPLRRLKARRARHVAMYLMRGCYGLTYTKIGELFGVHHTTAMHAFRDIEELAAEDDQLSAELADITRRIIHAPVEVRP